jgi:hypothetical protein
MVTAFNACLKPIKIMEALHVVFCSPGDYLSRIYNILGKVFSQKHTNNVRSIYTELIRSRKGLRP